MAATGLSSSSSATASSPLSPPTVKLTPATPPSPNSATFLGQHISSSSPPSSTPPASIPRSTPAIVVSEMKEKTAPTDSETALVGPPMTETPVSGASAKPGPLQYLSRRISGKGATTPEAPKTSPEPSKEKEKTVQTPTAKPSTASTSASTAPPKPPVGTPKAATTTSMSRPAQTSAQKVSQKKKRKRKGLAGFFAALGCLSAGEFEDDEKSTLVGGNEMTEKPGTGATKTPMADSNPGPSTKAPVTAPEVTSKEADARGMTGTTRTADTGLTGTTATTGTTVVGGEADNDRGVMDAAEAKPEAVILAPVEPVTLPEDETAGVTSSAVQPPGSGSALLSTTLRPHPARRESDTAAATPADNDRTETSGGYSNISESDAIDESSGQVTEEHGEDYPMNEEYEDEEDRLIAQGGMGIPLDEHGQPAPLLPVMDKVHSGRKCLVLDLDETLLHSSFKMLPSADFIVPVEIETQTHNVYVIKRPGVDHFLKEMGKIYEIVVFTASLSKYADPVLDILDVHRVIRHRLFRESCYNHKGNYVKDLSQLGREMENSIIIDNSPASYIFHPNNAVPVSTWFNDPHDTELTDLCPFLADLATVDDIRGVLDGSV